MKLERKILNPQDLRSWTNSAAYANILSFIETVSKAVTSKLIQKDQPQSKGIASVSELIDVMLKNIEVYPPETQPQRFGNRAFRSWFAWFESHATDLCWELFQSDSVSPEVSASEISLKEGLEEASQYLVESVGNSIRIDYGTGHELAFLAFLICLFKLGVLKSPGPGEDRSSANDLVSVGLTVMPAYLSMVRKLQLTYRMEPAGSHGVWCLDDFQFVPFIWGASQLIGRGDYEPRSIPNAQIAAQEQERFLFFSCINYIYQVKSGPFEEHSQALYGISQVPHWEKVQSGLIKMYKAEVLGKYPVMQHFLFGRLLTFDPAPAPVGPRGRLPFVAEASGCTIRTTMPPPASTIPPIQRLNGSASASDVPSNSTGKQSG